MAANNEDYAIVIGIDTYSSLFRLRSAHADAQAFADWLTSKNGGDLPEENVELFLGPPKPELDIFKAKPIRRDIDIRLQMMGVDQNERIGRRLYFYFAGHGFGPEFDNVGMLMIDASETTLNNNIGLWQYRQFFKNHHIFDEVIFIIDCCRDPIQSFTGLELHGLPFTLPNTQSEVLDYVVMAAAYGEKAYAVASQDKGQRRGLLTRAILEGLEKATDGVGRVTSSSLRAYVLERVPDLVEELKGVDKKLKNQVPEIVALPHPPIVFTTISADQTPKLKVQVIAGPGKKGDLILYDGGARQLDKLAAKDATDNQPWELELDRNSLVYVLEHSSSKRQIPILPKTVTQEPHVVIFE